MQKQISHYQILSKIASGGMANIYLALDTNTGAKVAIKILKEEVSDKEKILERFSQEGLLNLDHPNIVKILDAGVHENTPYIVMEYVDGEDLEALIKSKGKLPVNEALSVFGQLLSALAYVHNRGIIHRDIKPKNILIDKSGKVKLTDFGIAKSLSSHVKTSTGGYLGAPAYSSPEQMDGLTVDNRSDIYSLGITFYEMLSGVTPFSSTSIPSLIKEKFSGKYRQVSSYRQDVPSHVISVISKCIAVNPKDRFGSAAEIINALNIPENTGTVIIGPKPKQAVSVKKISLAFSILTAIMLVAIITLSVSLAGTSSQLLKSKDEIAALTSTLDKEASPKATADSVTDSPGNTITTDKSADTATAENTAETTSAPEMTAAGTTSVTTAATVSDYNIGDTGPAGGFIFYVNPDYETDGWRYLEAAPSDFPGDNNDYWIQWEYSGAWWENHPVTGATATAIGTGMSNTQKIVDIQGNESYAAKLCSDLTQGGYSDWFLPSKDELNLMYENLHLKGLGSFEPAYYWSSSEYDADYAWDQSFGSGNQYYDYNKFLSLRVRAIRAFDSATPEMTAAETTSATIAAAASDYNIGDPGPAGGFIFYINPNYEVDGWRYLEAAPSDFPGDNNDYGIQWDYRDYGNNPVTGAAGTTVGTGMTNTQKIVDMQGNGSYAAKLCSDLIQGGFSDWFMPSRDELNLMYENLYLNGLGSFEPDYYWSSSEVGAGFAWIQYFDSGGQFCGKIVKDDGIRVRPVRAF